MTLPQDNYHYGPEHGQYTYFFKNTQPEQSPEKLYNSEIQVDLPFNK